MSIDSDVFNTATVPQEVQIPVPLATPVERSTRNPQQPSIAIPERVSSVQFAGSLGEHPTRI
jgi:hypothetical protein